MGVLALMQTPRYHISSGSQVSEADLVLFLVSVYKVPALNLVSVYVGCLFGVQEI